MEWIIIDMHMYISHFLSDFSKISLSSCSKKMDQLKYLYKYVDRIDIEKICALPFYDNFTKIRTNEKFEKMLGSKLFCGNNVSIELPKSVTNLKCDRIDILLENNIMPKSITHLKVKNMFNIENMPLQITYLSFGSLSTCAIEGIIPQSVTHLGLSYHYSGSIKNCIPPSVTCLKLGRWHRQYISEIPSSVTHVIYYFHSDLTGLPASVTTLTQKRGDIAPIIPPTVQTFYHCPKKHAGKNFIFS